MVEHCDWKSLFEFCLTRGVEYKGFFYTGRERHWVVRGANRVNICLFLCLSHFEIVILPALFYKTTLLANLLYKPII